MYGSVQLMGLIRGLIKLQCSMLHCCYAEMHQEPCSWIRPQLKSIIFTPATHGMCITSCQIFAAALSLFENAVGASWDPRYSIAHCTPTCTHGELCVCRCAMCNAVSGCPLPLTLLLLHRVIDLGFIGSPAVSCWMSCMVCYTHTM